MTTNIFQSLIIFFLSFTIVNAQSENQIFVNDDIQLLNLKDSIFVHITWEDSERFGRFPSNGLIIIKNGQAIMVDTPMDNKKTRVLTGYLKDSMGYATIALIGLFGGALSALLKSREKKVTAVTFGISKSQVYMRLLLGASGAFVIFVLMSLPGFVDQKLVEYFASPAGFIALGIISGFSERLFLTSLDKLDAAVTAKSVK